MKRGLLAIALAALVLSAIAGCAPAAPTPDAMAKPTADAMMAKTTPDAMTKGEAMMKMPDQMMGMHFTSSMPKHAETVAKTPDKIVLYFNATLSDNSAIQFLRDDKPLQVGSVVLASDKLSMSVSLPKDTGDGLYVVKYKACWLNKTCDDGSLAFQVDAMMH